MRIQARAVFACALLVVALFFVVGALGYDPLARQVPLIVGIPMAALIVVEILDAVRRTAVGSAGEGELGYHLWLGGFIIGIYFFGFLFTIPFFLFAMMRLRLGEKSWVTLITMAVMWAVGYIGFIKLMEVPLFGGILWG
jgi:hypothetical protein